jgi:serine/threonine protein kinase
MFEEEIGRGGFGVVYKAQHLRTHELVAIKRFSLRHVEDNLSSIQVRRRLTPALCCG